MRCAVGMLQPGSAAHPVPRSAAQSAAGPMAASEPLCRPCISFAEVLQNPLFRSRPAGEGSDEAVLATARMERDRRAREEARYQAHVAQMDAANVRRQRVARLLEDAGLHAFYTFSVASIAHYIETGEGQAGWGLGVVVAPP